MQGAEKVCFQDFNVEVLDEVTKPLVNFYLEKEGVSEEQKEYLRSNCEFIHGDWADLS